MKANNQIVQKQQKGFSNVVNSPAWRAMIDRSIGDPQQAASLVSTLISVVNANSRLQMCNPASIISAALRGEIGMGLSVALGEYSIVPYRSGKDDAGNDVYIAQFQLGANGLKRLCIRSGEYRKLRLREVRKGEFAGFDEDGDVVIRWHNDPAERETLPIVGYFGMYELLNGFKQSIYWSHEQILKHADHYAKAFSLETYNDLLAGKITGWKAESLRNGSPWYAAPEELPHRKMCLKTIAKQLLGDGLAPKEVMRAIRIDNAEESEPGSVVLEEETLLDGAVVPAVESGAKEQPVSAAAAPAEKVEDAPKKRGRSAKPATEDVSTTEYAEIFPPDDDDPLMV